MAGRKRKNPVENKEIIDAQESFEGMLSRAEEKRALRQKNKKKKR